MPTDIMITNNGEERSHNASPDVPLLPAWQSQSRQSRWGKELARLLRLPAQEGVSCVVNDIPDVCRITQARIGDCGYVPCGT